MGRLAALTIALCVAAGCGGCGSGETPGPDGGSPPKPAIVVVDDDATEPVPDGFARLNMRVVWPPTTRSGLPRTIFADCVTVGITATGPGIFSPVTTTITRPDDTGSLVIPAGVQRLLTVEERDAADQHLATCDYTVAELLDGQTYDLTFVLLDDYEPNDSQSSATTLPTNDVALRAVLHEGDDEEDWYQFAIAGTPKSVRFSVTDLITVDPLAYALTIQLLDTDGATVLEEQTTSNADPVPGLALTHAFVSPGTYYLRVSPADAGYATWEYRPSAKEFVPLADTPWPMVGHDPLHTGRSPYVGAQTPTKKWDFATDNYLWGDPAIGSDGTIYFGGVDSKVHALNPDGTEKWDFATDDAVYDSCPAIGADGTIYIGADDGKLYALNPDGTRKWDFATGNSIWTSPAIGADGTIYFGSFDNKLYAVNADGTKRWDFAAGSSAYSPAIGADGTIYFGSDDKKVYALDGATGAKRWEFATEDCIDGSPAIGADGTIYIGSWDHNVYALDGATGAQRWEFLMGDDLVAGAPAIGADGTIYIGSNDGTLYALNPDGTEKWSFALGWGYEYGCPAIGADGTIYTGSDDGTVYALDADGTKKWDFATEPVFRNSVWSGPVIGADGTVYFGSLDCKLYAIGP